MPGNFLSPEGDLEQIFVNNYEIIDRLAATGSLWLWGFNGQGQLGTLHTVSLSSPIQTIAYGTNWKEVSAGMNYTAAIKTDGTLWTWGTNSGGLGTNDYTRRSSPIQTVAYGTNWKQVSVYSHSAAIKTDGTLWVWGNNSYGQLGLNNTTDSLSPIQTITYGTNWKQVSAGNYNTAAIKTDGTLWVWGLNNAGQLGTNDRTNRSSPIQTVAYGTNWKQVAGGLDHTVAIKTDGTLWTWGFNSSGQLGTNDTTHRSSPIQTIAYGTNWKQVSAGYSNTVAIKTDGTLWTWGLNSSGQLGTNDTAHRSSPIQTIAYGTNWKQVSAGYSSTVAIKTDGTLWTWGFNGEGQLGTNDRTHRSSPIQTITYGTNWKQVSAGNGHIAGIYFGNAGSDFPSIGS